MIDIWYLINCESNNKADENIIEMINLFLNVSCLNKDNKMKWFKQTWIDEAKTKTDLTW